VELRPQTWQSSQCSLSIYRNSITPVASAEIENIQNNGCGPVWALPTHPLIHPSTVCMHASLDEKQYSLTTEGISAAAAAVASHDFIIPFHTER
jgi:hypothetical protein